MAEDIPVASSSVISRLADDDLGAHLPQIADVGVRRPLGEGHGDESEAGPVACGFVGADGGRRRDPGVGGLVQPHGPDQRLTPFHGVHEFGGHPHGALHDGRQFRVGRHAPLRIRYGDGAEVVEVDGLTHHQ